MLALNAQTAHKAERPERVIQFGEGNFLRAFADWMFSIMNEQTGFNGNVVVVQPTIKDKLEKFRRQDCLYHVNLQGLDHGKVADTCRLIDVISRAVNPYSQFDEYLKLAEIPEVRFIISNTTEAGITFDPSCQPGDTPAASYPGKLTQLLFRRFRHFRGDPAKGVIILPCELIPHNGQKLKEAIGQYIALWRLGEEFETWFHTSCRVYATLVDRIVPGFPAKTIGQITEKLQYDDQLVTQGEVFHLWVIEAPKSMAREIPAADCGLNVQFVDDETPYHQRKVTLLNGPHTLLSPVAYLSGIDIVRDACRDETVGSYIRKVMYEELLETLDLPKEELRRFADSVLERFNNPFIDHQVTSIMLNAFPKFATRDLPGLKIFLERKGCLPRGIVFGLAALATYYKGGHREDGASIRPEDAAETIELLGSAWKSGNVRTVAETTLGHTGLWHEDLNAIPGLTDLLAQYLDDIRNMGMKNALKQMLAQ